MASLPDKHFNRLMKVRHVSTNLLVTVCQDTVHTTTCKITESMMTSVFHNALKASSHQMLHVKAPRHESQLIQFQQELQSTSSTSQTCLLGYEFQHLPVTAFHLHFFLHSGVYDKAQCSCRVHLI